MDLSSIALRHLSLAHGPMPLGPRPLALFLPLLLVFGGCSSLSSLSPSMGRDGAPAQVPAGLERTPNAVPRVEAIRPGGPNKPYEAAGQRVVPFMDDKPLREEGLASWYGTKYHGRPTSNGETYDMFAMTAAHRTMPIPSYARVKNPANGREVIVRVNDRGPFVFNRVIDLSYTAALKLGVLSGVAPVIVERITFDEIRKGVRIRADGLTPKDLALMADGPGGDAQRPPLTLSTAPVQ